MKQKEKPAFDFLAAPARRALASLGVFQLQQLENHSESEIKQLHGIGASALKRLKEVMAKAGVSFKTKPLDPVSAYIALFPEDTANNMNLLRACIQKAAPDAEEYIGYGMPAYKQNGPLVYFAGYAKHIGFYPTGEGIEHFKNMLTGYKTSKGAVQFPLNKPLPLDLISSIVQHRVLKNQPKPKKKTDLGKDKYITR